MDADTSWHQHQASGTSSLLNRFRSQVPLKPVLHALFGPSAAGSLRQALALARRQDQVACLYDDLAFGPINPADAAARIEWVEKELGYTEWDDVTAATEPFIGASLSRDVRPVAWFSRRDAHHYAGFLWWLWRLGDAACDIIDVTELAVAYHGKDGKPRPARLAVSPSLLLPHHMSDLLDRAVPLDAAKRRQYRDLWQRLMNENAPLRVIGEGGLVSAPITQFDSLILSCATPAWLKMARVVGDALARSWEGDLHQTSDLVLEARARALAEAGALDWRGDLSSMHACEIRRPAVAQAI